jgi:hypothetical protein
MRRILKKTLVISIVEIGVLQVVQCKDEPIQLRLKVGDVTRARDALV